MFVEAMATAGGRMGAKLLRGPWPAIIVLAIAIGVAATTSLFAPLASLLQLGLLPGGASPGLVLVLGGLVVMTAVALVALFGSTLEPARVEPSQPRSVHTRLRTDGWKNEGEAYGGPRDVEHARGRSAGASVEASSVDSVFDQMVAAEMGEPRILRSLPSLLRVRLHACRGCAGQGVESCAFETGFLEGALSRVLGRSAVAREVRCRGTGAPACEFEVWY